MKLKYLCLTPGIAAILALSACAMFGGGTSTPGSAGTPKTFTDFYSLAVQSDDVVVTTTNSVLVSGLISSSQAQKVQDVTVKMKGLLDTAYAAYQAGDALTANTDLGKATVTLVGMSLCLTMKPLTIGTFENCINPILAQVQIGATT